MKSSNNAHRDGDQVPVRARDFYWYSVRGHQIEQLCCELYLHKTYTKDARGHQSRTLNIEDSDNIYIKIYVFEHADYEYEG